MKLLYLLPAVLLAFCSSPELKKENSDSLKSVNTVNLADSNIAVAKKLFERFNRHDWKAMAELYTNPAIFKDPSLGQDTVLQTHEQTIGKYAGLEKFSPNVRDSVIAIYPSGDKNVIVEFISSGGEGAGKWSLPICTIFTIENGKITQDYTYYDNQSPSE